MDKQNTSANIVATSVTKKNKVLLTPATVRYKSAAPDQPSHPNPAERVRRGQQLHNL
jgi:hypothetical protein